jgi:hypothetical protein
LELDWEQEHVKEGRYTLDMVRIDEEIKKTINHIKAAEAKAANHQNKIDGVAPMFSIAG